MDLRISFDNSYARLPGRFYSRLAPTPVAAPSLIRLNEPLARSLEFDVEALRSDDGVAMLAGNLVPEGAEPLAQAYAGHQFGGWVPQLGDGRAILLGEVLGEDGRRDVQLKGSGPTPFSRMGDGRAWLGPVLREYVVSEAMHALGIPTTRALAAVSTGEEVLREARLPGAVLTRVARSHVRVGTFQYFAARQDVEGLQALTEHVLARHYPDAAGPLGLLQAVVAAQAELIAAWMSVGFIHGVMNTDNMSVAGETIDYGPCAFMDAYHPDKVFSSIDRFGRYAYSAQPQVAVWNIAQFATCLIPLMGEREAAIEAATEAVHAFPELYQAAYLRRFRVKLGLRGSEEGDAALIGRLLDVMAAEGADFTATFRALTEDRLDAPFRVWRGEWLARLEREGADISAAQDAMRRANPVLIPRNHRVEEAISAAVAGDYAPFHTLAEATVRPWKPEARHLPLADPPAPGQEVRQTFCGT
ncbi:protein adenylyltransferase SelO [Roseitranquillus sediminis]|uniref:protein adenylyltransferase SelO n=1 Tax=Roseitranquillus sediminis TaxID=2809051 RepID=UPI001D0C5544|nr:YdiU family protein [Roseitranquillus sediminis]MBM9594352.1 YdiU family protein [Roseitranquillus sediminis]